MQNDLLALPMCFAMACGPTAAGDNPGGNPGASDGSQGGGAQGSDPRGSDPRGGDPQGGGSQGGGPQGSDPQGSGSRGGGPQSIDPQSGGSQGGVFPSGAGSARNWKPSIAVDASDRLHVGFADANGSERSFRYTTCANNCTSAESWSTVAVASLGPAGRSQIAVDSAGHPLMLLFNETDIRYGECNENCTEAGSWTVVSIVSPSKTREAGVRSFANPDKILVRVFTE